MNKFQLWATGGILSLLLGFMGVPWMYRQYLIHGTKLVIQESEVLLALKNFEVCSLLSVQTDLQNIERCRSFYIDYMPKKSKGFKQGDQFPFTPLQPAQIIGNYKLLAQTLENLKVEPLPALSILSHGSLELPTKENNYY